MKWSLFQRCVSLFHLCLLESDVRVNRVRNARYDNPEKKGHRLEKEYVCVKNYKINIVWEKNKEIKIKKECERSGIVID